MSATDSAWDDVYWALRRAGMGARATREFIDTIRPKMHAEILREATAKIRANTVIPSDVETAHDYAEFLADLIDPDKVSPPVVPGG